MWNPLIAGTFPRRYGPYLVRGAFFKTFGHQLSWWVASIAIIVAVLVFELSVAALRRTYFPADADLWQEIEHQGPESVRRVAAEHWADAELGLSPPEQMEAHQAAAVRPDVTERDGDRDGDGENHTIKSVGGHDRPVTGHSFG